MAEPTLLEELDRAVKVIGDLPRGTVWGYGLLMSQAAAEIRRLRDLVGAVSDLPAEDEHRLNRVYGGEGGYRGR